MEPEAHARRIISTLCRSGYQAYLVGGCVRDLLLGCQPKDFDVATNAPPQRLLELFPNSGQVGAHFGVVLVREGLHHVEVATFRSEHQYTDGRRPSSVHFQTDPREDVLRRDFTINGLMMDVETGDVLDYVGGRADLDHRLIRAIGDPEVRFREDHLRLLRAIRFAARFRFEIEPATWTAIQRRHSLIRSVSAERVRDDLGRILTEGAARRGFEMLERAGLLDDLLPEIAAMQGIEQPPEFHPEGDVWVHTLLLLERLGHGSPTLAWGALLHDVGKPGTFRIAERIRFDGHVEEGIRLAHAILTRLRFSRHDMEQVEALVANHMRFKDVPRMRESTLKRFLRLPKFNEHLELHRLDCLASHGRLDTYELIQQKLHMLTDQQLKPKPLVSGRDLITEGYQPGPQFSKMLAAVEDAQLEGWIHTREQGLELVRHMFPLQVVG